jgi:hypothetical protein
MHILSWSNSSYAFLLKRSGDISPQDLQSLLKGGEEGAANDVGAVKRYTGYL